MKSQTYKGHSLLYPQLADHEELKSRLRQLDDQRLEGNLSDEEERERGEVCDELERRGLLYRHPSLGECLK